MPCTRTVLRVSTVSSVVWFSTRPAITASAWRMICFAPNGAQAHAAAGPADADTSGRATAAAAASSRRRHRPTALLHGHGLREVPRPVDVAAVEHRNVVRE